MKKLVIFAFVFILFFSYSIQGVFVDRTLTKAICFGNLCRDFLVTCFGKEVIDAKPISGFVTFGDEWVDLREDNKIC